MVTNVYRSSEPDNWLGVTRAEMEAQLAISADYESGRTDGIIAAATQWVQNYAQQSIMRKSQAYTMKLDKWPENEKQAIYLPYSPIHLTGTFTLSYVDTDGNTTELSRGTDYLVNAETGEVPYITPIGDWPTLYSSDERDKIIVVYTVGPANTPDWAKEAIKAYGTYIYERDPGYLQIAENLVRAHRVHFDFLRNA